MTFVEIPDALQGTGSHRIPAELEAFFAISDRWRLSTDEQIALLGSPGRSTFFKWKKDGGALPADTRERISHLLSIWKSLRILFIQDDRVEAWPREVNFHFDGSSALELMLEGIGGVVRVRRYLDAQRGA